MTPPGATRARRGLAGLRQGVVAFQARNFRLFWFGQLFSLTGTWMQSIAQSWLVLQLTDSSFMVGLVAAFQFAPVTILGMLGGVYADRRNKRRIIIATQCVASLQALALALLTLTGRVEVSHILVLAAVLGTVNAFDIPTRQSFVVEMVGRGALMNAIAMNSFAFNTARILGPAVGGVLVARFGAGTVFLINAFSYAAVLIGLLAIRESELFARPGRSREGVWRSLKSGVRYVRTTPLVMMAVFMVGSVATFGMNFSVLLPVMARDVFGIGSSGFGLLMASIGIGSVTAGLFLAFRTRVEPRRTMLIGGGGVAVLGFAFALSPPLEMLPVSIALLLGAGFSAILMTATANTAIQQKVPDELRGRVMSVYVTVFAASVPAGALLAGTLAKLWGAPAAMATGGVLSGLSVLWAWWRLRVPAETRGPAEAHVSAEGHAPADAREPV